MVDKILHYWKLLSNKGVRPEHSYEDIKRIRVVSQASLIILISSLLYFVVLIFVSFHDLLDFVMKSNIIFNALLILIIVICTFIAIFFLKKFDYRISINFLLVSIPTILLSLSIVYDHSGTEYYYFTFLILAFYLVNSRKSLIFISLYYALLFFLSNLFDVVFHISLIKSEDTLVFFYLNTAVTYITSFAFLSLFIVELSRKQQEIIAANAELERNIKITNQQKEEIQLMMKELSHRTKNNLQLVSSIINIQSKNITDVNAKNTIDDVRNRIVSIALLHQRLYLNKNLNTFLLAEFINDLLNYLLGIYDDEKDSVKITKLLDKIEMKIDNGIHVGLLLNELLTNSFKHAMKQPKNKFLNIIVKQTNKNNLLISLSDSGQNINKIADQNFSRTFGASLIHSLVEQMKGTISFNTEGKNEIIITLNLDS